MLMPDLTVVSPSAVVPADRLTLGATDARACPHLTLPVAPAGAGACFFPPCLPMCMAEE
jgi:hypothetical protein